MVWQHLLRYILPKTYFRGKVSDFLTAFHLPLCPVRPCGAKEWGVIGEIYDVYSLGIHDSYIMLERYEDNALRSNAYGFFFFFFESRERLG